MKKIFLIMMIIPVSLLSSCTYNKVEAKPIPETVSYQNDIQPIWNQSCFPCHTPDGGTDPDLSAGHSYNALINGGFVIPSNAEGSVLYHALTGNPPMPPGGPLPQDKIDLVKKWINDGALNN